jgi:hypothetical protein
MVKTMVERAQAAGCAAKAQAAGCAAKGLLQLRAAVAAAGTHPVRSGAVEAGGRRVRCSGVLKPEARLVNAGIRHELDRHVTCSKAGGCKAGCVKPGAQLPLHAPRARKANARHSKRGDARPRRPPVSVVKLVSLGSSPDMAPTRPNASTT